MKRILLTVAVLTAMLLGSLAMPTTAQARPWRSGYYGRNYGGYRPYYNRPYYNSYPRYYNYYRGYPGYYGGYSSYPGYYGYGYPGYGYGGWRGGVYVY
jgi:hypothetical protein